MRARRGNSSWTQRGGINGIIAFIILGLLAGAMAKALMPSEDPGGFFITALIGVGRALIGGCSPVRSSTPMQCGRVPFRHQPRACVDHDHRVDHLLRVRARRRTPKNATVWLRPLRRQGARGRARSGHSSEPHDDHAPDVGFGLG